MFEPGYILHLGILISIYSILVLGSNILIGWANLLSLCQAAFYGIGAYTTAIALMQWHWPALPAFLAAIAVTVLVAVLFSLPLLRLKDDYFFLGTLGLQMITFSVLNNWRAVTNGPFGIGGIRLAGLEGIGMQGGFVFLGLSGAALAGVLSLKRHLARSPFGRILRGIRDDEVALQALGKDVKKFKIMAFAVSAAFLAIGGFLYAVYISYIDPTSFSLDESFLIVSALIIGGMGDYRGSVAGAFIVILLPELLRFAGMPDEIAANMRQMIFGICLVVMMRVRPQGLLGTLKLK